MMRQSNVKDKFYVIFIQNFLFWYEEQQQISVGARKMKKKIAKIQISKDK